MSIEITEITTTRIRLSGLDYEFTTTMYPHHVRELGLLVANPVVNKVVRIKLARETLKCGLREAKDFVVEYEKLLGYLYADLKERFDESEEV